MKRKLLFVFAVFAATTLLMALQKPVFFAWHASHAAGVTAGDLWSVVWHGLKLDMTVAGYMTVLPLLAMFASLWVRLGAKSWRRLMTAYFVTASLVTALVFAVDLELYAHWGFRLNGTVLIYLADPKEAAASIDFWMAVRQTLAFALYAALMIWVYRRVVRLFDGEPLGSWWKAALGSLVLFSAGCLDFLAIRGGTGASVANLSKVYFSHTMFLNHAATNPVFSFFSSLEQDTDYANAYPFFTEQERAARFEELRGNRPSAAATEKVLDTDRPNVVVIILESFTRTVVDTEIDGEEVTPNLRRLKNEGIWFENLFASSYRTDRGEVAVLSGFPGQTAISIMKMPDKNRNLPSIARSLGREGYASSFVYGGDLNFTDQASYMYATGWEDLVWQKDLRFDRPATAWGYDDELVCDYFADRVIALDAAGKPFLAGLLTLSSHEPFNVPFSKFEDKILNAMAFTDDCVGKMIDRLKASPAWKNLLVVLVADHGFPYKEENYYTTLRHRIPMVWTGGVVSQPRVVDAYASQIDICASVLAQMGIPHDDFDYSKDIFDPATRKFGYFVLQDAFGVADEKGEVIWNFTLDKALSNTNPELLDVGRTMLQTTYTDIANR